MWGSGDHHTLEEAGLAAVPNGVMTAGCRRWILAALDEGNDFQDSGAVFGGGGFSDNRRHYNRDADPKGATAAQIATNRARADRAYAQYCDEERHNAENIISGLAPDTNDEAHCREALVSLGRLHHSYQDFFSHAILRTGGWTAWTATPPVTGTPFDRGNFWPSSYPGEHPRFSEPVGRNSAEGRARFAAAQAFMEAQTVSDLALWWGPCKCLCNKKK